MQHTTAIEQPVWSDLQVQILNLLPSPPAKLRVSKTLIRADTLIPSVSVVRPLNVKSFQMYAHPPVRVVDPLNFHETAPQ
jgi:hypothetical protein